MNQEKQPDAIDLAARLETIAASGVNIFSSRLWMRRAATELQRLHALAETNRAELVAEAARTAEEKLRADQMTEQHRTQCDISKSAVATLVGLGYTDRGGEQWAPPIGKAPDFNLLDAANEKIADLQAQLSAIGAGGVEALRKPLQAVEMPDSAIAGALFDFCGYLTTMPKDQAITVSGSHEASSIVEALKAWAVNRSLHLDDADVSGWRVAPAQEHATQLAGGAVAYLDLGEGGYMDVGTDLSDEQLSKLPKGRHMLVIRGAYGVDGYAAAPGEMQKESDAAQLLKKYRKLCLEIGRGDSYHIARIDAAIAAAPTQAHKDEQA